MHLWKCSTGSLNSRTGNRVDRRQKVYWSFLYASIKNVILASHLPGPAKKNRASQTFLAHLQTLCGIAFGNHCSSTWTLKKKQKSLDGAEHLFILFSFYFLYQFLYVCVQDQITDCASFLCQERRFECWRFEQV